MKKYLILPIIAFFLSSCESDFTGVIDYDNIFYEQTIVSKILADSILSLKINPDSLFKVKIYFNQIAAKVNYLQLDLMNINNSKVVNSIKIYNKATKIDTFFIMSKNYYSGQYLIILNSYDKNNNLINQQSPIAQIYFKFDNGKNNNKPVCLTVTMPDTLIPPTNFVVKVKVKDDDGLEDIKKVYFVSYRPDGTTTGTQFELYDNGDASKSDDIAKDGTYSLIVTLPFGATPGQWKFYFYAVDFTNEVSEPLIKAFIVK